MPHSDEQAIYEGLLALLQNEFPKTCAKCGVVYPTLESFVDGTVAVSNGTGLMGYDMGDISQQVAMMRNCACGSTMATFCCDRRDYSEAGLRRRTMFEKLLHDLQARGIDALTARNELLAFVRGERSPILESLGVLAHPFNSQPNA
ncbi:MAG: oxidoreductase [Chthoniobacterales bacterium]